MKTNCTTFHFFFLLIIIGAAVIEAGREADLDVQDKSVERSPRKRRFDSESYERHVYGRELSSYERRYGSTYYSGYSSPYYYNSYGYNNGWNNGYRYQYSWQQWGKK
uniref:Uncharacterized protein n=1 Tax=Plectus sambesii TaxID=2011161 RepID=A0A914WBD1_9BILA